MTSYFPFEIIDYNDLVIGETYYIKLDSNIINRYTSRKTSVPVSDLRGSFVRLDKEHLLTFAVFKDVSIMNKTYKPGSCGLFSVKYPGGFVASDSCDTYSNEYKGIKINETREVYFDTSRWIFGKQTEKNLLQKRVLTNKIEPRVPQDITNIIKSHLEKGGKRKKSKSKKQAKRKQTRRKSRRVF
jgi:hypothetical protein